MAQKPKKTAAYDLKAADRKRSMLIRIALTATVIVIAAALFGYIVLYGKKPADGEAKAIRVATSNVITKDGTSEPKAVISMYEDFLCPVCRRFEGEYGPTITQLINSGAVAVDYYMVAILDSPATQNYSSRAGAAAYCVADEDKTPNKEVFSRFHAALYAQQPPEGSGGGPDNASLIETARQAGASGGVADCVNKNRYTDMVKGLAAASKVKATPTIRLNGEDISPATPQELLAKIRSVVGPVPALMPTAAPPAPAAPATAP